MADERIREACLRNSGTPAEFEPKACQIDPQRRCRTASSKPVKNTAKAWTKALYRRIMADIDGHIGAYRRA